MIEVDGSRGEGGGQILRTAIALSAVTGEAVRIRNIRANRPNPGLAPSHVTSIEAVARVCDGEVDDLYPGSKGITFRPGQLTGGHFEFDVGTAGSISLVLQSCLIPSALSKSRVVIRVNGGTDVKWSPPIDYMRLVHVPMLNKFGPSCHLEISARGFYPEGGGEVMMEVSPVGEFAPVDLSSQGEVLRIEGIAFAQNLPEHVVARTKHSALKKLIGFSRVKVESDLRKGRSTGAGIVLCAVCENTFLGASVLGARGVRAEDIGDGCAQDLLETLKSGATVDENMLDQILPYMALSKGRSKVVTDEITGHAETNMSVVESFLGKKFETRKMDGLVEVRTI
ncbi:MAG: RNA 3'-terminal phosphate cyclase [Candidatus Thermoplasmatota archaeon]|nr:RNA 3'-terminal phosphate cyclase [Candidatus Thermoplasmatota archaeon]